MNWEDLKFLAAIADNKTVRATAKKLGVHHSTVSRRVDALEHSTATKLLYRTPEGYSLTREGEVLAKTAMEMRENIHNVEREISGGERALTGKIRVSMPEPLAVHAFAPRLPRFQQKYPHLDVSISSSYGMADLSRQKADIAIRLSNHPDENLFGKRLFKYANAVYVSRQHIEKFKSNNWDNCRWIGWSASYQQHGDWRKDSGFEDTPVWGVFPDLSMQMALAEAGAGLAYLPCFLGDANPRLVRANDKPVRPSRDVWILTHTDLKQASKIRAFMQFSEETLKHYENRFLGILDTSQE